MGEAESERDQLQSKMSDHAQLLRHNASLEEQTSRLTKTADDQRNQLEFIQKQHEAERQEMNEVIQNSKMLLEEKIEEFKEQRKRYDELATENQELSHLKRTVMILEQEKRELETKVR